MRVVKIAGAAIAAVIVVAALLLIVGVPSGYPDVGNPGAGRARDRLQTDHRRLQQDRHLAVAQRDAERRHAAGPEGSRRHQPRHRRQRAGRRDAGEPVVGPTAGHRTRHQQAGAACAAAARTLGTADFIRARPAASPGGHRQGRDRPHHGDRRRGGVFQPARPRGKSHRGHQRRSQHRRRPQGQAHRQRQEPAIGRSNSPSTPRRPTRRWSGRTFRVEIDARRARPRCRRRCRPRPRCGSTARP